MNCVIQVIKQEQELQECFEIRKKVFIEEQAVSYEEEFDEYDYDPKTKHFAVICQGKILGTCRLRTTSEGFKIERVALLKEFRKNGYGTKLMKYVLDYCKEQQAKRVYLYAQETVIPFYENLGFVVYGDSFLDARIPHRAMKLYLEKKHGNKTQQKT